MISLRHFVLVTTLIKWFIILLGWYFIFKLCYLSYDYVLVNKSFFIQGNTQQDILKHILSVFDKNMEGAKKIALYYLEDILLIYVMKIAVTFFALFLYKRVPLPNALLAKWHEQKEIDHTLGKRMVSWLRWQTHFRLEQFLHCYRDSRIEKAYVNYHAGRKLSKLFESFDEHYHKDKNK